MFVVISQDQYKDVAVICICKDIDTAEYISSERNKNFPNRYCWVQKSEVIK